MTQAEEAAAPVYKSGLNTCCHTRNELPVLRYRPELNGPFAGVEILISSKQFFLVECRPFLSTLNHYSTISCAWVIGKITARQVIVVLILWLMRTPMPSFF